MPLLESGIGNYIYSGDKKYSYFAGNNYLGLASHPEVIEAAVRSVKKYGVNFSASRLTTGTADIHLELERELSSFKGMEDSVIYASGYQGNGILLDAFRDRYSEVYMDQLSHPSIVRNIPREITKISFYDHLDAGHLESLLEASNNETPLIITDGIFALTGEIAPLGPIYSIAEKHNAILLVDDAHSTGILGKTGRGTPEYFNLQGKENIFQTETMSKALGSYGGFIAGTRETTDSIRRGSSAYQASTSLPPAVVAASIAALGIIKRNPDLHFRLLEKSSDLRKNIMLLGYITTEDNTPIIPLMFSSPEDARDLSLFLEGKGIIVPFIHYPVKTESCIVRITVSVNHTSEQTEELLDMLKKWKEKNGKN